MFTWLVIFPSRSKSLILRVQVSPSMIGISKSININESSILSLSESGWSQSAVFRRKSKASTPWFATWTVQPLFRSCLERTFWFIRLSERKSAWEYGKFQICMTSSRNRHRVHVSSTLYTTTFAPWKQGKNRKPTCRRAYLPLIKYDSCHLLPRGLERSTVQRFAVGWEHWIHGVR